mgnify:CR=1 FL=1
MNLSNLKYNPKQELPISGEITSQSPSNIALVKYWGKKPVQIPTNPSLSFTLKNCHTITSIKFVKSEGFSFSFKINGQLNPEFLPKLDEFFLRIKDWVPFIFEYKIEINSINTFPHSSGIASSASGFSALSLAISQLEQKITGLSNTDKYLKASFLSRLGSGSASRSLYGPCAIWGLHQDIKNSCNEWALEYKSIHHIFENYQDTILLIDKGIKKVSSSVGHNLMHNHPFSKERYRQANQNLKELVAILKSGDLEKFILLTESEALTLHAMMMTSNPYFILMKEGTLSTIEKIWDFRTNSKIPLSFTLDAGANVHLLYPKDYQQSVMNFINSDLIVFCENQQYICDEVGSGAKILNESYA